VISTGTAAHISVPVYETALLAPRADPGEDRAGIEQDAWGRSVGHGVVIDAGVQVGQLASGVLGHPQRAPFDGSARADVSVGLRCLGHMYPR
jgi:hypothetical protein